MIKEAIIIDGKKISEHILADLKRQIETDTITAKLAIILVIIQQVKFMYKIKLKLPRR
jgi:5,10-methylene-tetrahydrofolate dehydrogenase/methenyl tetrahydrofolate cyclohydrolase